MVPRPAHPLPSVHEDRPAHQERPRIRVPVRRQTGHLGCEFGTDLSELDLRIERHRSSERLFGKPVQRTQKTARELRQQVGVQGQSDRRGVPAVSLEQRLARLDRMEQVDLAGSPARATRFTPIQREEQGGNAIRGRDPGGYYALDALVPSLPRENERALTAVHAFCLGERRLSEILLHELTLSVVLVQRNREPVGEDGIVGHKKGESIRRIGHATGRVQSRRERIRDRLCRQRVE